MTTSQRELLDRQRELIARAQAGDSRAEGEFILSLDPYLRYLARSFCCAARLPLSAVDDLVAEGQLAAITLVRRFDLSRNVGFITYAQQRMRQVMYRWTCQNSGAVTRPSEMHLRWQDVDAGTWEGAQVIGRRLASIDSSIEAAPDREGLSLADKLTAPGVDPEAAIAALQEARILADTLASAIAELDPRGRTIITGLLRGKTHAHTGAALGCSREWVRVNELRAKAKLKARLLEHPDFAGAVEPERHAVNG